MEEEIDLREIFDIFWNKKLWIILAAIFGIILTLSTLILLFINPDGVLNAMLSGGEKALVAIALYFAIMKVRPAPFCVMDEIEAALDEVNVVRFAEYARKYSDATQFIMITHRRGTMESADTLYGVTMYEKGISKVLTVNVREIEDKLGVKFE